MAQAKLSGAPLASRCEFPAALRALQTSDAFEAHRVQFTSVGGEASDPSAIYANFFLPVDAGGAEVPANADLVVSAVLERQDGTRHVAQLPQDPAAHALRLAPGALGVLSWPGLRLNAGEIFHVRTVIKRSGAGIVPTNYQANTDRGEGTAGGKNMDEAVAAPVDPVAQRHLCGPSAIVGTPMGEAPPSVALVVDSIGMGALEDRFAGSATGQRGYLGRAFDDWGIPSMKLGANGAVLSSFLGGNMAARRPMLNLCDAAIVQVANNDLDRPFDELLSHWRSVVDMVAAAVPGPVIGVLPGPKSHSTDNWQTIEGQTLYPRFEDARPLTDMNTMYSLRQAMKDEVGHRLAAVIDPLPYLNAGPEHHDLWHPGYTRDGTHPLEVAHIAAKSSLADAGIRELLEGLPR